MPLTAISSCAPCGPAKAQRIPALALTALLVRRIANARAARHQAHLAPFDVAELISVVADLVDFRRLLPHVTRLE